MQSNRSDSASRYLSFPPEAADTRPDSKLAIHKWEIETLSNLLLTTPKQKESSGRNRILNCSRFEAVTAVINLLRNLEDAEAGVVLEQSKIFRELHRIGQRQFGWQRGYFNTSRLYRYAFIYGQGECSSHFQTSFGISYNEFSLIGFALHAAFRETPSVRRAASLGSLGISQKTVDAILSLISTPIENARDQAPALLDNTARAYGGLLPVAYYPSFLRRHPIVTFDNGSRLRAPLPELIMLRTTSGVYYDLISGPSHLRNDASERFEKYCVACLSATKPSFEVCRREKYAWKGQTVETPDILVRVGGKVKIALECKATKLTFDAQFSKEPISDAKIGYEEIAKGVFQLWRYLSHARRGIAADIDYSSDLFGVVLTLDTWLVASRELQQDVFAIANKKADKDREIVDSDRIKVAFCAIEDFEQLLLRSTPESFWRCFRWLVKIGSPAGCCRIFTVTLKKNQHHGRNILLIPVTCCRGGR